MSNASGASKQPFDLTPSEEQQMMRESMQRFAEAELLPAARDADEQSKIPDGLLDAAHELGITLLAIPEQYGGAGSERSPVANALIAEDLGRGDMALALAILSPLGVLNTILDQGTEAQREACLPRFAEEKFQPAATAVMESRALFDPENLQTTARAEGDGWVLNGEKRMVALSSHKPLLLVLARVEGEAGPAAFLVEGDNPGVSFEAEPLMGLRGMEPGRVSLKDCRVGNDARLGGDEGFDARRFLNLSRLGLGATAAGVADGLLAHAIDYTNERVAFGEPISHRQSVAFMVANIGVELEGMRLMVQRAASRAEQGLDFEREATLAARFCADHSMEIGTNAVQLLGGHGFTQEYLEEMCYRHMRAVGILEGCFSI